MFYFDIIIANSLKQKLAKFKYSTAMIIFLEKNKIIWVFLVKYITISDLKLREII